MKSKNNVQPISTIYKLMGLLYFVFGCVSCSEDTNVHESVPSNLQDISYQIVSERLIPNGGYSRVIVVGSKYRNESDLKLVANRIKWDTRNDRNSFVFIYDDKKAASLRTGAIEDRLNKKDLAYHDYHMIGAYTRNINTGYHSLISTIEGIGKGKKIGL